MNAPPAPHPALDIQSLSRRCHRILILAALSSGPHHGYQLALELEERSGGMFRFHHGTLYPILHKLEGQALIRGDWLEEPPRRRRKSYRLTDTGTRYLKEEVGLWHDFFDRFFHVVEEARQ